MNFAREFHVSADAFVGAVNTSYTKTRQHLLDYTTPTDADEEEDTDEEEDAEIIFMREFDEHSDFLRVRVRDLLRRERARLLVERVPTVLVTGEHVTGSPVANQDQVVVYGAFCKDLWDDWDRWDLIDLFQQKTAAQIRTVERMLECIPNREDALTMMQEMVNELVHTGETLVGEPGVGERGDNQLYKVREIVVRGASREK